MRQNISLSPYGDNSNWMRHLPESLWKVPLWNLSIPGSHDTMTNRLDDCSPVVQSESLYLRMLDLCFPCCTRPCVKRWATTQAWDVTKQLDAGIRFLDLRIAYKKHEKRDTFYFAHGIYSSQTVQDTIFSVAQWLREHPKEVLIIACSAFDGMDLAKHRELISMLQKQFGKKLWPKTETPSLLLSWEQDYQVVLSYDNTAAEMHLDMWPQIEYWWANTPEPKSLITYLEGKKQSGRPAEAFFVAGLNLTEDLRYVLQHPWQTMQSMTLNAYDFLIEWIKKQQSGSHTTDLNIICADFVEDKDFISVVIALNEAIPR